MAAPTDGDCSWLNDWILPGRCGEEPPSLAGTIIDGVIGDAWVQDFKNGVSDVVKTMFTFWTGIPDPQLQDGNGNAAEAISFLWSRLAWLAAVTMCFLFLFQSARIIVEHRGQGAQLIMRALAVYFVVMSLAIPAIVTGLAVTSAIAVGILDLSTDGTAFADNLFGLFNNAAGITSTIALCALLLIAIVLGSIQAILMIGRGGALYLLICSLFFAASSYASETGREAFNTIRGWIIAFVSYKLVAAAIYGVGFRFLGTDIGAQDQGLLQIFYGLTLLIMAIIALPATLRLLAPPIAPLASGSGLGPSIASAGAVAGGTVLRRAA